MSAQASSSEPTLRRVGWWAIAIAAALLIGLWALDLFVLRTTMLTSRRGDPPLTPLYTFFDPVWTAHVFDFAVLAILAAFLAPRLANPERTQTPRFVAILAIAALALPIALFLVRQPFGELGAQSITFRYEDFLQDVPKVGDVRTFLRNYVESMPRLSLHGQHYPPGPAIYLHGVANVFGPSPLAAGLAIVAAFAAAIVVVYAALRELVSERAARQGALLVLSAPTALDHACGAWDAVFLLGAACAWLGALRAFRPGASVLWSVGLGLFLVVVTCMSFSVAPVGLSITLFALFRARKDPRGALLRLAVIGIAYLAGAWLLWFASGFSLWECLVHAKASAARFMGRIIRMTARATYPYRSLGNISAFLIGGGVALLAAVLVRLRSRTLNEDRWSLVALTMLGVMTLGGIYYMETERIWLFVVPWVACIAVGGGAFDDRSLRRLMLAAFLQAWVMEIVLFTFW